MTARAVSRVVPGEVVGSGVTLALTAASSMALNIAVRHPFVTG